MLTTERANVDTTCNPKLVVTYSWVTGRTVNPLHTSCPSLTYVIIFTKIAFAVIENIVYSVFLHRKTVILFRETCRTDGNIE